MSGRYLLDTNTARYVIKGNIPRVRQRLLKAPMAHGSACDLGGYRGGAAVRGCSQAGAARLKVAVKEFPLRVEALPWDSKAARYYADVRATLERDGKPLGNLDMMIAAHALTVEAILVTSDRAFRRLGKLKLEDWTK